MRSDRKATVTQRTSLYNCDEQGSISEWTRGKTMRWMVYRSRAHVRSLSCLQRTETWGCSDTDSPTLDSWTLKNKIRAWSDESVFLLRLLLVESQSGVNSMKPSNQRAFCQQSWLLLLWGRGDLSSRWDLKTSPSWFECDCLSRYCYRPCSSLHGHSSSFGIATSSRTMFHVTR